eukprot:g5447.t1
MSFWGSSKPAPNPPSFGRGSLQDEAFQEQLKAFKAQMEMEQGLFAGVSHLCAAKCITRHDKSNLDMGEETCIDRCSVKYIEAFQVVSKLLTEHNQNMQQQ